MNFRKNQVVYTHAGFAIVKSVRSLNQTLEILNPISHSTRKKSKVKKLPIKEAESDQSISPQNEVTRNVKSEKNNNDYLDFNFGEVFLLLERLAGLDEVNLKVEKDGLVEVVFVNGGYGYLSPE